MKIYYLLIIPFFLIISCTDDHDQYEPEPENVHLKVIGKGTVQGLPRTIIHHNTQESLVATCFLMDLIDPETQDTIGTLEDCVLSMVTPSDGTITSEVITSIQIDGRGTIQSENIVFQELIPPVNELNFITSFTPTENNVFNATLEFEGMEGTVSLEGEINLSQLGEGIVTFNCLFEIQLNRNK